MSKVLVTGGCGFLGSHVCELFMRKGWDVIAYDNMTKFETSRIQFGNPEKIREYNRKYIEKLGVQVVALDIRDKKPLEIWTKGCDYIINCAAQPTMTLSSLDPRLDFETNVLGTVNLLEIASKRSIPLATCSTIHVYGTGINDEVKEKKTRYIRRPEEISEEGRWMTGSFTPLHASKASAELYVQMYADTYDLQATAFRLTGIYGERQFGSEDHGWVSLLAIKTMLGLPIQLIGNGKQVRDIIYVNDAAQAFWDWHISGKKSGVYNICGGKRTAVSVLEVLDKLRDIFGKEQNITSGGTREGDLLYFVGNYSKATKAFGWEPSILVDDGLRRLADWLKSLDVWVVHQT